MSSERDVKQGRRTDTAGWGMANESPQGRRASSMFKETEAVLVAGRVVRGRRVWSNRWGPVVKCLELSVRPLASTEGTGGPLGGILNPHCRETRREQTNLKRVTSAIQGSGRGFRVRCSSGGRPKWANSRHVLHLSSATYIPGTVVSGHKFVIITSGFPGKWPNKMLSLL